MKTPYINKVTGNNAYSKHALKGQNNGSLTILQKKQQGKQKGRNAQEGTWQMPVRSSSIISYQPRSIASLPGTSTDITSLRDSEGNLQYGRLSNGAIVMCKK